MIKAVRANARTERGETLVEVLLSVAILSIAIATILAGLITAVMTSGEHRSQATANSVLISALEAVKDQARNPYVNCATTYDPTAGVTLPAGWSAVTITAVKYWSGTAFVASGALTSPCPATPAADKKLQLITVQVVSPDAKATEAADVVKRNPA
jgi:type II secretory pathway pseudopilin PulG